MENPKGKKIATMFYYGSQRILQHTWRYHQEIFRKKKISLSK